MASTWPFPPLTVLLPQVRKEDGNSASCSVYLPIMYPELGKTPQDGFASLLGPLRAGPELKVYSSHDSTSSFSN